MACAVGHSWPGQRHVAGEPGQRLPARNQRRHEQDEIEEAGARAHRRPCRRVSTRCSQTCSTMLTAVTTIITSSISPYMVWLSKLL